MEWEEYYRSVKFGLFHSELLSICILLLVYQWLFMYMNVMITFLNNRVAMLRFQNVFLGCFC